MTSTIRNLRSIPGSNREENTLINFKEQEKIDSVRGALALRAQIEPLVDNIWDRGLKNLCFLGIGGTWASCLQVVCYMKETMPDR